MLRKTVRVGGTPISVTVVDKPIVRGITVLDGIFLESSSEIQVVGGRPVARIKEDLWHELFHALIRERNLTSDDANEERWCTEMSLAMNALCVDNGVEFWEVPDTP